MSKHQTPTDRKKQILDVALQLARDIGYMNVTRERIAVGANCSTGTVSKYFATMPQLRRALMRAAVTNAVLSVIAEGLVTKDPNAIKAPDALKKQALDSLLA